jgi:hypothetical protein
MSGAFNHSDYPASGDRANQKSFDLNHSSSLRPMQVASVDLPDPERQIGFETGIEPLCCRIRMW